MLVMILPKIETYLMHIAAGISMRGLARAQDVEPSSIKRLIDNVTDHRDAVPEWDEIITPLEQFFHGSKSPVRLNPAFVGRFFKVPIDVASDRFDGIKTMLTEQHFTLAMASEGGVGLMDGNSLLAQIDRTLTLVWIACGWVGLKSIPTEGMARRYIGTEDIDTSRFHKPTTRFKEDVHLKRALDPDTLKVLRQFQMMWQLRDTVGKPVVQRAKDQLHPELLGALLEFADNHGSFQRLEAMNKIPARSGKVLLRIGLETIAQYDEMQITRIE